MRRRKKTKFEEDAVIVNATISRIDFVNFEVNGKLKTVFYCPSYYAPEGRMCVMWGKSNIQIGDEVQMKGRFSDGVFLVWNMLIISRKERETA